MNKYFNIIISIILFGQFHVTHSAENSKFSQQVEVKCAPQLKNCLSQIQSIPEARDLIANIQKEGAIQIQAKNTNLSEQFGAFWDGDERTICIAISPDVTNASIIGSILFELQNASVDSKFVHFNNLVSQGAITKLQYIESMEFLEYENSHRAAKIAEKGIRLGILPQGSRLPTYSSFKEHYAAQKMSGHSDCFAQIYDALAPRKTRSMMRNNL